MKKARIYTRTGDTGDTGLFGGGRVSKTDARVEAYGAVDELNAAIGVALAAMAAGTVRERLAGLQPDLFAIGAHLATPPARAGRSTPELPELPAARIALMERWIDEADAELPPLRAFVMPCGSPAGAALHFARTVCRRAERRVLALAERDDIASTIIIYLNRLSDLLFMCARVVNQRADTGEAEWTPAR